MTDKEWWLDDETYYLLECGKLKDKLEIATKALEKYTELEGSAELETIGQEARQALKEMEEV